MQSKPTWSNALGRSASSAFLLLWRIWSQIHRPATGRCRSPIAKEFEMTICPIALVAGCAKCPAFAFCPLKTVIGDYKKPVEAPKNSPGT